MCILCVASRWSRRIVTMLPWLIIPLIILWALSQLLPPGFRFEVTSPRLACVGVLLFSLAWYELLMPRLSEWRAKRSARLHEKRKIEAQEAAKWRKEAIRKCRNCDTAYKDQNPAGGKFMCTYCGHVSKRPALDVPGGNTGTGSSSGLAQFFSRKDLRTQGNRSWTPRMFENNLWPGIWSGLTSSDGCVIGQNSAMLILFRVASWAWYCAYVIGCKLFRRGMSGGDRSRTERQGGHRKGEDGNCQESRAEKLKRKAEEKRLAKLKREQREEEERIQREEVSRMVDERQKQKQRESMKDNDAESETKRQQQQGNNNNIDKAAAAGNKVPKNEDTKKCSSNKAAKKQADDSSGVKVGKPVEAATIVKADEVSKPVTTTTPVKSLGSKMANVKPAAAYPKYQPKASSRAFVKKQDKPLSTSTVVPTTATKVSSNDIAVVNKPSAWNRISWWGKTNSNATKDQTSTKDKENRGEELFPDIPSKDTITVPKLPPPLPAEPPTNSYFVEDTTAPFKPPSSLSPFSAPFPSPTKQQYMEDVPVVDSLYSTFMSSATPMDPWSGTNNLASWKMWDAPNLELPRLTQALASPPVVSPKGTLLPSLLSIPTCTPGVPSLPISNTNIWSDQRSLESARRIWKDSADESDFRIWKDTDEPGGFRIWKDTDESEATPPEFVDCITQELMQDPVIAADGHSYERTAIEKWLKVHDTSPKTGEVLPQLGAIGGRIDKSLRPNHNLRGQIIEYKESLQRGSPHSTTNSNWQATTEGLMKKAHIGGLYTPPGAAVNWAYNSP